MKQKTGCVRSAPQSHGIRRRRRLLTVLATASSSIVLAACGSANVNSTAASASSHASGSTSYPSRAITIICPFAPGSAPDTTIRELAGLLSKNLGQSVVVENNNGGNGVIGLDAVQTAKPNGYTLGDAAVALVDLVPQVSKSSFAGPSSIEPIAQYDVAPFVLFVNANSSIHSVSDLVAQAKSQPGKLAIGVDNPHAIIGLNVAEFQKDAGISIREVSSPTGQQVLGVVNGSTVAGVSQPGVVMPYVKAGKVRIIGVFASAEPPGVSAPLMSSLGYDVHNSAYEFLFGPKGLPSAVVAKLDNAVQSAMTSPIYVSYAKKAGLSIPYLDSKAITQKLDTTFAQYGTLVHQLGWVK